MEHYTPLGLRLPEGYIQFRNTIQTCTAECIFLKSDTACLSNGGWTTCAGIEATMSAFPANFPVSVPDIYPTVPTKIAL